MITWRSSISRRGKLASFVLSCWKVLKTTSMPFSILKLLKPTACNFKSQKWTLRSWVSRKNLSKPPQRIKIVLSRLWTPRIAHKQKRLWRFTRIELAYWKVNQTTMFASSSATGRSTAKENPVKRVLPVKNIGVRDSAVLNWRWDSS